MKYQDVWFYVFIYHVCWLVYQVFELSSEIRKWILTEDADLIRAQDIPERMQLATSSLSSTSTLSLRMPLTEEELGGAAMRVTQKLSFQKNLDL